jgi:hypothetical protein
MQNAYLFYACEGVVELAKYFLEIAVVGSRFEMDQLSVGWRWCKNVYWTFLGFYFSYKFYILYCIVG